MKTCCGYSLEAPCWGASNEYHNISFCREIRKIQILFGWKSALSRAMRLCIVCLFQVYACLMIFFISNAIEGQLISTGAFEVAFNGKNVSFFSFSHNNHNLTLLLLNMTCPVLANSVDPNHLASEEANWSGAALFVIKYVNFYQKPGSSNLIGWKLEVGMAS